MREILFKAKRIDNGEWVEGYYCIKKPYCFDDRIGSKEIIITEHSSTGTVSFEVNQETICQYTGLTDKNGNKIWENDIIKKHFYTDYDSFVNSEEYIGKVEYLDCAWCIRWKREDYMVTVPICMAMDNSHDAEYFEVIGNIFDNPEL